MWLLIVRRCPNPSRRGPGRKPAGIAHRPRRADYRAARARVYERLRVWTRVLRQPRRPQGLVVGLVEARAHQVGRFRIPDLRPAPGELDAATAAAVAHLEEGDDPVAYVDEPLHLELEDLPGLEGLPEV